MLRQHIDAILEAESEAKRRLAEAEGQARVLIAEARDARAHTLEQSREDARDRARDRVEQGRLRTQQERDQILATTRAGIAALDSGPVSETFLHQVISTISGLPP